VTSPALVSRSEWCDPIHSPILAGRRPPELLPILGLASFARGERQRDANGNTDPSSDISHAAADSHTDRNGRRPHRVGMSAFGLKQTCRLTYRHV
jgi:hypothetical protein